MNASPKSDGFVGIGAMGEPMALNLRKADIPLIVWNRTPAKCMSLKNAGATISSSLVDVFSCCSAVIFMLVDGEATDAVLDRADKEVFAKRAAGRTIINMATPSPTYSKSQWDWVVKT